MVVRLHQSALDSSEQHNRNYTVTITEKFTHKSAWVRTGFADSVSEEFGQGTDICLSHLKRFELGEFAIGAQRRDDLAQPFERVVEAVHAAALPSVGRQPPLLHHVPRHRLRTASTARFALSDIHKIKNTLVNLPNSDQSRHQVKANSAFGHEFINIVRNNINRSEHPTLIQMKWTRFINIQPRSSPNANSNWINKKANHQVKKQTDRFKWSEMIKTLLKSNED